MATTPIVAATPSPPPHIHTPNTPRLGFADSWEPFSPRKSSRIASKNNNTSSNSNNNNNTSRSASARTPSPSANVRRAARPPRSPKVSKQAPIPAQHSLQPQPHHLDIASLSPAPTPRKKRAIPNAHFLSPEDALKSNKKAAAATGESSTTFSRMGAGMLPTPAKTPSKKVHAASQNESNIAAIARNLFHHNDVDEVMASPSKTPSRSKGSKKYTGFSLESFAVVEDEEPIPIFTDSQDRVPEADSSAENPFFGDSATTTTATAAPSSSSTEPARRRSKRNQVSIPGEGKLTVEEATRREDGLVYVFRGKKIFRKFEDAADAQEEDILDGMGSGNGAKGKRMTRSAIKPRLLFPREDSSFTTETTPNGGTTEDEEADTDIEDGNMAGSDDEDVEEETFQDEPALTSAPNTPPPASKYAAPASPPTTTRARRSGHKAAEELTPKAAAPKKRSPFDGWRQTKSSASAAGHKRTVDALGSSPTAAIGAKRSRA